MPHKANTGQPDGRRDPGLWHGSTRVACEDVKRSHRTPCACCGVMPEDRRLSVRVGGGRGGFAYVLCAACAVVFVQRRAAEGKHMIERLRGRPAVVRLTPEAGDPTWGGYRKIAEAKRDARRAAKASNVASITLLGAS